MQATWMVEGLAEFYPLEILVRSCVRIFAICCGSGSRPTRLKRHHYRIGEVRVIEADRLPGLFARHREQARR